MTSQRAAARALFVVALVFVAVTALLGVVTGSKDLVRVPGALHRLVAALDVTYGSAGVAAVIGLVRGRRWGLGCLLTWAVAAEGAALAAPLAYAPPGAGALGAVMAGGSAALLLGPVTWYLFRYPRRPP